MMKSRFAVMTVAAALAGSFGAFSCSEDAPADSAGRAPGVDAAADPTLPNVPPDAAGPADAAPKDVCAVQAAYRARCPRRGSASKACEEALLAQCPEVMALEGKLQHDSVLACESETSSCDPKEYAACNNAVAERVAPTPAQAMVRDRACEACGGGADAVARCKKEFFFDRAAGGPGAGFAVFLSNDVVAEQMGAACADAAPDAGGDECQLAFYECSTEVFAAAHPAAPPACAPPER